MRLLNAIASNYKSASRVLMEYVDNSIDSGFALRREDTQAGVNVHMDVDPKRQRIWVRDKCGGMDGVELGRLINGIGNSQKMLSADQNGQFGFGVQAFRAMAQLLVVYSSCGDGNIWRAAIDRDESTVAQPQRFDSVQELLDFDSALATSASEGAFASTDGKLFFDDEVRGTAVSLQGLDPSWVHGLRGLTLARDIESHFEGVLRNDFVNVSVTWPTPRNRAARQIHVCEAFDYTQLQGTEFSGWYDAAKKSLELGDEESRDSNELHFKIIVSAQPNPQKRVRFLKLGRTINSASELASFQPRSSTTGNAKLWEHPGVCGFVEVGSALDPVLTRDDFKQTQSRREVYAALRRLESTLEEALEGLMREIHENEMSALEGLVQDAIDSLFSQDRQEDLEDQGELLQQQQPEDGLQEFEEDEAEMVHDEVAYKLVSTKPKKKRVKQGMFRVKFVHQAEDAIEPVRSFRADDTIFINSSHPDYMERAPVNPKTGSLRLTARSTSYLVNEIAQYYRDEFYSRLEHEPPSDRHGIYRDLLDTVNRLERTVTRRTRNVDGPILSTASTRKPATKLSGEDGRGRATMGHGAAEALAKYGDQMPYCEPSWYQGGHSPYYTESHRAWRDKVRKFVEEELQPNTEKWIETGYPKEIHERAYELGIQGAIFPVEYGGTPPEGFDAFHEVILWDELARCGGGMVFAQLSVNSMALPPVLNAGSDELKARVVPDVVSGKKFISLALSEPTAGSDITKLQTTAVRDGDHFVVSGSKKWITGGHMADYLTTLVATDPEAGVFGLSMLLIETDRPGVNIRKMETQFDTSHSTTFITFDEVRVPVSNIIGEENQGFMHIVTNLNHERLVIAISACRSARTCYQEALHWVLNRKVFGKELIQHQVIQYKLAELAQQIESLQDSIDRVAFQFKSGVPDAKLGSLCSMLKVQASRTFEHCAREASQLFGGASIVKEGRGKVVERLYREVRTTAIPGGSEELLMSQVGKDIYKKSKKASGGQTQNADVQRRAGGRRLSRGRSEHSESRSRGGAQRMGNHPGFKGKAKLSEAEAKTVAGALWDEEMWSQLVDGSEDGTVRKSVLVRSIKDLRRDRVAKEVVGGMLLTKDEDPETAVARREAKREALRQNQKVFEEVPLLRVFGSVTPNDKTSELMDDIGEDRIVGMTDRFYQYMFEDAWLDQFVRSHEDPHGRRLGTWFVEKMGGGEIWTMSRPPDSRTKAHRDAWTSPKRDPSKHGRRFKISDTRMWIRNMGMAARAEGLDAHQPFFNHFRQLLTAFIGVYERSAPPFVAIDFNWSANPKNIEQYVANGHVHLDLVALDPDFDPATDPFGAAAVEKVSRR
ncbi:Acyl-CoA dehydrogenase AFT10-1 (AF-toxin biosynthesis protein 10-1) [Durusdinium trenchii]|uniref:Acyl-CoA dehydrogenase AFT10-1 (AF-toxin biosynthesis protein 10-1) n=1 Tax=Durusdinium trenchii TaxID=1381693 RepID=A0ABP0IJW7_9DINO